jgi:hypothetical protein
MDAFQNLFLRNLLVRLNKEVEARVGILTEGKSVTDIAAYRQHVGYIQALKDVSAWADEVHKDLMRPDDEQPNPQRALGTAKRR